MAEAFTVTQVNNYIKNLFSRDYALNRIRVRGEVSNCKYHSTGHIYFTLKDEFAALNCVIFAGSRQSLKFRLTDGQQIEASGQISVYEKSGSYQLYVRDCVLAGAGELYERFLKLKEELEDMGMFADIYKKPIPQYCKRVGIVTSPTGAAIRDIINVSKRRNPYVELILYPALVQGDNAPESIVKGIRRLDEMGLDVLIVGRGGGSIEDLWAFNDRSVAQAVFEAETPIISAVGHETDFTIADFVADLRAPTPSAAAELANFDMEELIGELSARKQMLKNDMGFVLELARSRLESEYNRLERLSPRAVMNDFRHRTDSAKLRMEQLIHNKSEQLKARTVLDRQLLAGRMSEKLEAGKKSLAVHAVRLDEMSPLKKISGGYGFLSDENGHTVSSVSELKPDDMLNVYVRDGRISTRVITAENISYE